ncbi:MAG: hypothetical protein QW648_04195, partial [Nanoarchaeales archaeon]
EDIEKVVFEAAKIVIYVNNKDIFLNGYEIGKNLAQKYKKRVEIRYNHKLLDSKESILNSCEKILQENGVKVKRIFLEKHRSIIVIDTYEPEKINLEIINKIREKTLCNV